MAQQNRPDLKAKILANLPDNTTEAITPIKHREVEDNIADSNYNILTDNATVVTYNPTTGTDWVDPDPTEVGGALDDLAGRVTTLEGATVSPTSISFNVNSDSTVSLPYVENEPIIIDTASEAISQTLANAYYQVSTDAENWIEPNGTGNSTLADLATWINLNITSGTVFSIRAIGIYVALKTGEANIKFNFTY